LAPQASSIHPATGQDLVHSLLAHKGLPEQQVHKDHKAFLVLLVLLVLKAHRAFKVLLVRLT
jgi:hypothetical protein